MATPSSELAVELLPAERLRTPPAGKVTFEEFLEWCDDGTLAEWVDGEIELMASPVSIGHQDIAGFLDQVLGLYVVSRGLGKTVLAPYVMKLASISRGREPDLIFVKHERLHLLTRLYLDGPADLAIEIVSPTSVKRDSKVKLAEYESAGIPEYWLIDPDHRTARFYELGDDGHYRQARIGTDSLYRSKAVTGFWLRVDWLWQEPLPNPLDVLRALKVI